ncbi:hypothetical protein ABZ370_24555 [Streptomyces sp. NPDC005962]|uniref:hypothetical protein n=1 Tax=Streptomyces sp. NPDC005962 TaxID=3154466 RepID=UPI0033E8B944
MTSSQQAVELLLGSRDEGDVEAVAAEDSECNPGVEGLFTSPNIAEGRSGVALHLRITVLGPDAAPVIGGQERYTGQVYLPEEYNEAVAGLAPYNQHTTLERLRNEDDLVYQSAGGPDLLLDVAPVDPRDVEAGLTASFTLTVASA